MSKVTNKKSDEELQNTIENGVPGSALVANARKELRKREFLRKGLISWLALGIASLSMFIHILKYIKSTG